MNRLFFPAVLTFLAVLSAFPARAKEPSAPVVRAFFEENGAFRFCMAESLYEDGRKITFAYSPKAEINLGLTIPGGGFSEGRRYDLELGVEGSESRHVRAVALSVTTLLLQMGQNSPFSESLKRASSLFVEAGGHKVDFDLPDMKELVESLEACIQSPPAAAAEAEKEKEKETKPTSLAQEEGFPVGLRNFLERAGLGTVRPVSLEDVPEDERPADYVWETGNILGGVRERTVPSGASLSEIIGYHMEGLKEKCPGTFSADIGREQRTSSSLLRPAQALCVQEDGVSVLVSLLFSLSLDGVFSVFTHEGPEADKLEILAARDKIGRFLAFD